VIAAAHSAPLAPARLRGPQGRVFAKVDLQLRNKAPK